MKEAGTLNWTAPNTAGNNNSGFTGLPGGYRSLTGIFDRVGLSGYWWSASEINSAEAWFRDVPHDGGALGWGAINKRSGFSVRCVRD